MAFFSWDGNIPVDSDWFIQVARMGEITRLISFRRMLEIPSWPELDLDFRLLIILFTVSGFVGVKVRRDIILSFKYWVYVWLCGFVMEFASLGPMLL